MCISVVCIDVVLAKAKFGDFNKWDEELPLADHEAWSCRTGRNLNWPYTFNLQNFNTLYGKGAIYSVSSLSFYSTTDGKMAWVVFYSPGTIMKKTEDWLIPDVIFADADFALAAFPPQNKKMITRLFKRDYVTGE